MTEKPQLKRALGFWWLYAIGVGAVVGDGIFTFTGYAIASAGSSVIIAYLIAGFSQMFLMLSFGELAVWKPSAGGPEPWAKAFLGKEWGFLASTTFSIGWIIAGGTVGLAIGTYVYQILGYAGIALGDMTVWVTIFALVFVTLYALLNIIGVEAAAGTQFILTMILIIIMVAYAISGAFYVDPNNYQPFMPNGFSGFLGAIPIGVYAFMGASTVLFAGEEAKKPTDVAKVLLWSSLTFIIVYTGALAVVVGTVPYGEITKFYDSVYAISAMKIWGPWAAGVMSFAAWLAASTCLLMGTMYQPARDLYNLARKKYRVPKSFGYVHPKFRTPVVGIVLVWIISVILILIGTFAGQTLGYQLLGYELVWAWSVSWFITLLAAIKFRKTKPDVVKKLPWRIPGGFVTMGLGMIGILLTVFAMFYDLVFSFSAYIAGITAIISIVWVALLGFGAKYLLPKEGTVDAE